MILLIYSYAYQTYISYFNKQHDMNMSVCKGQRQNATLKRSGILYVCVCLFISLGSMTETRLEAIIPNDNKNICPPAHH